MQNINEQTELISHTAEAEGKIGEHRSEVSLGKFKDVSALLDAYNSLQSEFTKRCQKIKELEAKLPTDDKVIPPVHQGEQATAIEHTTLEDKQTILKEYLGEILGKKPSAIVMDGQGVGVKALNSKPVTVRDAGNLAQEFFSKQSN